MPRPKGKKQPVRLSVGLDTGSHTALALLADEHGVSVAWLIRKAVSEFIEHNHQDGQAELPLRRTGR